jgi:hypothetical protein
MTSSRGSLTTLPDCKQRFEPEVRGSRMSWGGQTRTCHLVKGSTLCGSVTSHQQQCDAASIKNGLPNQLVTTLARLVARGSDVFNIPWYLILFSSTLSTFSCIRAGRQVSDLGQRLFRHGRCSCSNAVFCNPSAEANPYLSAIWCTRRKSCQLISIAHTCILGKRRIAWTVP